MKKLTVALLSLFLFLSTDFIYAQECGPNLTQIYSFPIGSEFQYKTTTGGEMPVKTVRIENYTITDKWHTDNTMFYTRNGSFEYTRYSLYPERHIEEQEYGVINDTVWVKDTPQHFLNSCEDELVRIDSKEDYYSYMKVENSEKIIGGENNLYEYDENNNLLKVDDTDLPNFHFKHVFEQGIGLQLKESRDVMSYTRTECEGYVVNGKAGGVLTSVNDIRLDDPLKIYPNIVEGNQRINIESSADIRSLTIVSLDGKIIPTEKLTQNYLTLEGLPEGMYFLTFVFDDHRTTRKVFKQ